MGHDLEGRESDAVGTVASGAAASDEPTGRAQASALEQMTRPLLELMQVITGLETTFITHINWDAHAQEVVHALNSGTLIVPEGSVIDWSDSMCRRAFLSGKETTSEVHTDFPNSLGGERLGMQTFMAVPIIAAECTIGTVCGASRERVEIDARSLEMMRLVARSMAAQLAVERESRVHRDRADMAEVLALTDALTGLANRRAFTARWAEELARSTRHDDAVAVLVIDVDDFKSVNDTFGHDIGDEMLRAVGDALSGASRSEDIVARLGGDEFVVAATHTDADGAMLMADRIGLSFARAADALGVPCTLSVGMSSSVSTAREELLEAADAALYEAKRGGRDRVAVWQGGPVAR